MSSQGCWRAALPMCPLVPEDLWSVCACACLSRLSIPRDMHCMGPELLPLFQAVVEKLLP